jgi:tape measure domain-containing protein
MAKADVDISVGINDKAITAALDKLTKKIDQFGKSAERSTRQAAKGVQSMTDSLYMFERRIATVTRAFQLLGAGAALAVFKNFIDQAQSANNALKSISETQDQFNNLQKESIRIANLTGEAFRATATGVVRVYRSIEELGGTSAEAIKIVETLNKTLLVSGATGSEATSTLIQFTQALQSGVLQGDELRSLRENAPLAMKAIAKAAGVTTAELKKMGSEGKLTTELLMKAFTDKQFIKELDEMRSRMDRTFSQSLQVASNNLAVFFTKVEESTGVLSKLGDAVVALSTSFNVIANNKFLIGAAATAVALAKFGPAVKALGSASLIASSSVTILGISIARATVAVKAFILTNAPLIAITAVILAIGAAFDELSRQAEEAKAKVQSIREEIASQNMKFNDFLTEDQLNQLTDAQTQLKLNSIAVANLNKQIELYNKLQMDARGGEAIAYASSAAAATKQRDAILSTNAALKETINLWREYAEGAKSALGIRTAIDDIKKRVEEEKTLLEIAREKRKTGSQELAEYDVYIRKKRDDIALLGEAEGFNKYRIQLLREETAVAEEGRKALVERLKLEAADQAKKPRRDTSGENLARSYAADLEKARISAQGLRDEISAMQGGATEDSLKRLREEAELRTEIIDIQKRYAKLPGGADELIKEAKARSVLNSEYDDSVKVFQKLLQLRQDVVDITFETYAAEEELAALQSGATAAQLEDLRASLEIREKYSLLGDEEIERLIKLDKERRKALKSLEDSYKYLEDSRRAGEALGTTIGQALADIATGAGSAEDAVRRLLAQILEAIAQAAILRLFNQQGAGGFWGDVLGSIGGGRSFGASPSAMSGGNVRIINLQGGGITQRRSANGDTTVIIGAVARDVLKGGTPLALAIERTYGVRRLGV